MNDMLGLLFRRNGKGYRRVSPLVLAFLILLFAPSFTSAVEPEVRADRFALRPNARRMLD